MLPIPDSKASAKDFKTFFESVPEDKWGCNKYIDEQGCCCSYSLLGARTDEDCMILSAPDLFQSLTFRLMRARPGLCAYAILVNDGPTLHYPQARVLVSDVVGVEINLHADNGRIVTRLRI